MNLEKKIFQEIYQVSHFGLLSHVIGTSFAILVTSQERNVSAKFQPDQPSGLAGKVEIGDRWTDGQTVPDDIPDLSGM